MLNYQTTSFHDALYVRRVLGLQPAPEFALWLEKMQIMKNVQQAELADNPPDIFLPSLSTGSQQSGGHQ